MYNPIDMGENVTLRQLNTDQFIDRSSYPDNGIFFTHALLTADTSKTTLLGQVVEDTGKSLTHKVRRIDMHDALLKGEILPEHRRWLLSLSDAFETSFNLCDLEVLKQHPVYPISESGFNSKVCDAIEGYISKVNIKGIPRESRTGYRLTEKQVATTLEVLVTEMLFELRFGKPENQIFIQRAFEETIDCYIGDHKSFARSRSQLYNTEPGKYYPKHLGEIEDLHKEIKAGRNSMDKSARIADKFGYVIKAFKDDKGHKSYARFRHYLAFYAMVPYMNMLTDKLNTQFPLFAREVIGAEYIKRKHDPNFFRPEEIVSFLSDIVKFNIDPRVITVAYGIYTNGYPNSGKHHTIDPKYLPT